MKFKIFEDAFKLYQGNYITLMNITDRTARFDVDDVEVRVEHTSIGLKFHCDCTFHQRGMLRDKLCKRIVAIIQYIRYQKKKIHLPLIEGANRIKNKLGVWLIKADDVVTFDVNGIKVIIEKKKTGTRFKCNCEYHKGKDVQGQLCLEVLATLFYLYDKRGKVKL